MNKVYQHNLYNGLENLLKESEAFYSDTVEFDGRIYRSYNYRLATWDDYHLPFGLEARGTMFDITNPDDPIFVSAAPRKFFNYEQGENLEHHLYGIGLQMEKMDGSLISTYLHKGNIYLKSKMSLMSIQSNMAMAFLNTEPVYKEQLQRLVEMDFTVNLELISPENQIVVPYEKTNLIVLNVRSLNDGSMMYARELTEFLQKAGGFDEVLKHMVPFVDLKDKYKDHQEFLDKARAEVGLEGYVIEILAPTPYLVKVKNLDYVNKHYIKDGIGNDRRLFESIINEETDDLRSVFAGDHLSLKRISDMENMVMPIYNHLVSTVKNFHENNKNLSRKDYAIKSLSENKLGVGNLCIAMYIGQEPDFKAYAKRYRREVWNIGGEPEVSTEIIGHKPIKIK